jgi:threonine dehydrogenase-like Zn-dependent dehydrogenase
MRATLMYGAGDVRVEEVPDAHLMEPSDALIRVTRAAICGSDLWPYKSMEATDSGRRMGHEFIGVVEAVGSDVQTVKVGELVLSPFLWSDGTCVFCREGLQSECLHGGRYGSDDVDGGQGEAVRVPQADGTLVALPVGEDDALMPSLLTLTDVMGTGHHAAVSAKAGPEKAVAVARPGGAIGRVGVPEHDTTPTSIAFWKNASMAGGPAPVRAYIQELLPDVLEGRMQPGRVFNRTGSLDEVPNGYRRMNERQVLKFQIDF